MTSKDVAGPGSIWNTPPGGVMLSAMPRSARDAPFLMPVDKVLSIAGRGVVVTGTIDRGLVRTGDAVEIVGLGVTLRSVVTSVQASRQFVPSAQAGDSATLLLGGIQRHQVRRGQVLAQPGSLVLCRRFAATLCMLSGPGGGQQPGIPSGCRTEFSFRTMTAAGTIDLGGEARALGPGEIPGVTVHLSEPVALEPGEAFTFSEGGKRHPVACGSGIVTAFLG
jgi:elongation factor Tu